MYKDWIDEIVTTEKLPEYQFSPFPKPNQIAYEPIQEIDDTSSATKSNVTTIVTVLSVILTILSHWTANNLGEFFLRS